jgi:hypothetical protein
MGCDIHLFVEFPSGGGFKPVSDGAFLLPRDYRLFAALSGVRAEQGFAPFVPARGIPRDVSQEVASRYFVPVVDDERAAAWAVGEHFTESQARRLVDSGASHWLPADAIPPLMPATHGYISHPDWHSAGWLTANELHLAFEHARYSLVDASEDLQLLIEFVGAVAARKGQATRVVFWFDN